MNFKRFLGVFLIFWAFLPLFWWLIKLNFPQRVKEPSLKEASFWQALSDGKVQCQLCPNNCILAKGEWGLCKARQNLNGKLYSQVYGRVTTAQIDPIEKKPFYHFLPGQKVYSLATSGCNLDCLYCQNWDIAKRFPADLRSEIKTPEEIAEETKKSQSSIIAFTYNEPIVWYEYMLEIAKLAKNSGLKTVMVSNGYINQEPLLQLIPYLDAVKIDLKGFNEDYYRQVVGGQLAPVLETLKTLKKNQIHLEIVTLLVPGKNDSEEEIKKECLWLKENLGEEVPVHFSRFFPMYKMENLPPTPEESIKRAREICLKTGLKYVYAGNISDFESTTTYCPINGQPLIIRKGYFLEKNLIDKNGQSEVCPGIKIPGIWQ